MRKYPRRSCGSFWSGLELRRPNFDRFRPNFPIVFMKKCVFLYFSGFLLPGWLPGDPRPFPNERSLNSHILCGPKSLIGQDLTYFYLTQSLESHLCKRPTIYDRKMMECLVRNNQRTNGKHHLPLFLIRNQSNSDAPTYISSVPWYPSMI